MSEGDEQRATKHRNTEPPKHRNTETPKHRNTASRPISPVSSPYAPLLPFPLARTISMAYDAQQWTYHGVGHRNDKLISFLSESCPLDTLPDAGSSTTTTYFDADALVRCVFFSLRAVVVVRPLTLCDRNDMADISHLVSLSAAMTTSNVLPTMLTRTSSAHSRHVRLYGPPRSPAREISRSLHTHNTSVVVPPPVAELRSWVQSQASGQSISKDFNAFEEFISLCCDGGYLLEFAAECLNSTSVAAAISLCSVCIW